MSPLPQERTRAAMQGEIPRKARNDGRHFERRRSRERNPNGGATEVGTRVLKQAVKRNMERFEGDDFMFVLTEKEVDQLVSQIVIPSKSHFGGAKPYAFSELGVAMLSSVLNSKTAIEINRSIMRAFVVIRQALTAPQSTNQYEELKQYMDEILLDQNEINEDTRMQLELINQTLAELQTEKRLNNKPRRPVGYKTCADN